MPIFLIDEIQPKNAGDFPMVQDVYLKGGYRVVADTTERDAITDQRKTVGMVAHVVSDGEDYRWNGTIWDLVIYSSAVNWGDIEGLLSDQTDLQDALDLKADASDLDDLVVGPASATDNAIALFNTTTGKIIKNSVILVDSSGNISGIGSISAAGNLVVGEERDDTPIVNLTTNSGTGGVIVSATASAGGDPRYNLNGNSGVVPHYMGLDDSDSYNLKRGFSSTLGDAVYEQVTPAGIITHPLQPMFWANLTGTQSNVTGDGTVFPVIFDNEVEDRTSSYDNSTGVFTAEVAGMYGFWTSLVMQGFTSLHTNGNITFITTGGAPSPILTVSSFAAQRNDGNNLTMSYSAMIPLDVGDEVYVRCQVSNGTKVVDVVPASNQRTYFAGYLIG
jgi:hypothetical protein